MAKKSIQEGTTTVPSGNKKKIHINMHVIRANGKHGTREPVVTCKSKGRNDYGHQVQINGPSKVIYSPDKPLSCGAKVWIETSAEVEIIVE